VRRADHLGHELLDRLLDVDHVHLRARDHDVAHLHLGDGERALGDGQRVGVEQVALIGRAQQLHQVCAVGRLAQDQRGQALEQAGSGGSVIAGSAILPRRDRRTRGAAGCGSPALHARGVASSQMVVAAQVQHAVHHQVRVMRAQRLALLASLPSRSPDGKARRRRCRAVGKRQNVGGVVLFLNACSVPAFRAPTTRKVIFARAQARARESPEQGSGGRPARALHRDPTCAAGFLRRSFRRHR
jgi:hypothetical protein